MFILESPAIMILLLMVLSFFIRALPQLIRPRGVASDPWYHLLAIDRIKMNGHRTPERLKGLYIPNTTEGKYTYPFLFHWLLSFLPGNKETRLKISRFVSPTIDSMHVATIVIFSYYAILQINKIYGYSYEPFLTAILAGFIYAITPLTFSYDSGQQHLSERPFGLFLTSVSLWFFTFYFLEKNNIFLILSIISGSLVFLSSKFSIQVLFGLGIMFSLFLLDPLPLLVVISGLLIAILLSSGKAVKSLNAQYNHLKLYRSKIMHNSPSVMDRNRLRDIFLFFKSRDLKEIYTILLRRNTITIVLIQCPFVFMLPIIFLKTSILFEHDFFRVQIFWIVGTLLLWILTSFRPFLFLGEAERYVIFGLPPLSFLISLTLNIGAIGPQWTIFVILTLVSIFIGLAYTIVIILIRSHSQKRDSDMMDIINFLNSHYSNEKNILSIPTQFDRQIAYFTRHNIFTGFSIDYITLKSIWDEIYTVYPYPSTNLKKLTNDYNLNLIIYDKSANSFLLKRKINDKYDLTPFSLVHENDTYQMYEVK